MMFLVPEFELLAIFPDNKRLLLIMPENELEQLALIFRHNGAIQVSIKAIQAPTPARPTGIKTGFVTEGDLFNNEILRQDYLKRYKIESDALERFRNESI